MDQLAPAGKPILGSSDRSTIYALASSAGPAIAVLRLSGSDVATLLAAFCPLPPPRRASLRTLRDPRTNEVLDHALVLFFAGPASYTGEDCAELHLHGGPAVVEAVSAALLAAGAHPADPGEFTRRAFLNGRMDLLEAEAVADLVAAESEAQRRQALRQLEGELGALYRGWTKRTRELLADAEAAIDFSDHDVAEAEEAQRLVSLRAAIRAHLADRHVGERVREGLRVVIAGAPNSGKSSLLNVLARRDLAIVSASPGTTRDAIETRIVAGGAPVTLVDTAGLRVSADPIEREGVQRAESAIAHADIVLAVTDATAPAPVEVPTNAARLAIANKCDLAPAPAEMLAVSALTGAGVPELRTRLDQVVAGLTRSVGSPPLTRARHRTALLEAEAALGAALSAAEAELKAEELRRALAALGRITGAVGVEDVLDTIFTRFCIGK